MLDGHMSAVTSMSWSPDDTILMSVGAGGAIYRWDAVKFERMRDSDHVDKVRRGSEASDAYALAIFPFAIIIRFVAIVSGTIILSSCLHLRCLC